MSKPRNVTPEEQPEEQPQLGGSYQRDKDGSLTRVEGPELPEVPVADEEQAPAGDAIASGKDGQEG